MKATRADEVCQRIYDGWPRPGDWIELGCLIGNGILPSFYNVDIKNLSIKPKRPPIILSSAPKSIYQEKGFKDRWDYLDSLTEETGAPDDTVRALAELLGEEEDFDGLLNALEDFQEE